MSSVNSESGEVYVAMLELKFSGKRYNTLSFVFGHDMSVLSIKMAI